MPLWMRGTALSLAVALGMAAGISGQAAGTPGGAAGHPFLLTEPWTGPVGSLVRASGAGFPPGAWVELRWETVRGSYRTGGDASTGVRFFGRRYTPIQIALPGARADAQGRVRVAFHAPEDFGEVHRIDALIGGRTVAQGSFTLALTASMSPSAGPVGTPITIEVHGIPYWLYQSTMALAYDNRYTGFVSATTTHGTARFRIRAAGGVGTHGVALYEASNGTPYLNLQQSPARDFPEEYHWTFRVTQDARIPADLVEWPAPGPRHPGRESSRAGKAGPRGATLLLQPASGPVGSVIHVRAHGLPPGHRVALLWTTPSKGNRVVGTWTITRSRLADGIVSPRGTLSAGVTVPDDLGGWHAVVLVEDGNVLAQAPYFVTRSLVRVFPRRVRAGQQVTIEIKGVGWTELDNGVAVTYDDAYLGYACGFNSRGDITLHVTAVGRPGAHLIDLYPMIYQGHGLPPWTYQVPQLTVLDDGPGLARGYVLPIIRVAVQVIP